MAAARVLCGPGVRGSLPPAVHLPPVPSRAPCLCQIHLYIPETGSGLYGVSVRAILRDSTDVYSGRRSEVWVDSDGQIGNDRPDRTGEGGEEGGGLGLQATGEGSLPAWTYRYGWRAEGEGTRGC